MPCSEVRNRAGIYVAPVVRTSGTARSLLEQGCCPRILVARWLQRVPSFAAFCKAVTSNFTALQIPSPYFWKFRPLPTS